MAFRFSVCFGPPAFSSAGPCQMAVIKHKQHVVGEGISNIMEVPLLGTIDERCVVLQKLGMTTIQINTMNTMINKESDILRIINEHDVA